MSVEIAWKQNNLVTDFHLLKLLQVVFGFGLQTFVCNFSRQNICSVVTMLIRMVELGLTHLPKYGVGANALLPLAPPALGCECRCCG